MPSRGRCHGVEPFPAHPWKWDGRLGDRERTERWIALSTGQCPRTNPALTAFGGGWVFAGAQGYGQVLSADITGGHFILQPAKAGRPFPKSV